MNRQHRSRVMALLLYGISFAAGAVLPTVPTTVAEPVPSYGAAGLLQAGFWLAIVVGLIFLFAWLMRRVGLQQAGSGRLLKVVSSVMVGQRERVVVLEIGDSWLVLGVAAGQVQTLHTMPARAMSEASAREAGKGHAVVGAFAGTLRESLSRLKQRGKPL